MHKYLGYFNIIENIKENNKGFILLRRITKNYSYFSFFREYEGLINNAIKLFGIDYNNNGIFNWKKEIEEIKQGVWKGRFWNFGTLTLLMEINAGIKEICLIITAKNE